MKVQVVKVGGQVAEDPVQLQALLKGFAAMEGPKVLVHGGGREATALAGKLGIPVQMVEGRRITDAATLEVVTMVYAGLVNKRLVAQLQALGVNAIGLCGADGALVRSHKRPPVNGIDYGFVGDVDGVNADLLASLLSSGFVPVVSPLTYDGKGSLLNTNADTIASTVATALAGQFDVTLTFCFDLEGVLDASGTVIPQIDAASFETLKTTGALTGGILPKITNALAAVKAGVGAVRIAKYDLKNPGTLIQ
ncbi:MAG: acetylglutamate kinase [Bacteroidales bacterium]|jgi:acetylglutamate kinase|nr:acetylglutamate kinase [Bacteroidales bacterium]MBQ2221811.1 acetylglutamate kinase [Bacteroidales bacterium]MBQ2331665.1 acetylglutamate kinase [Bacteroidales bacterium]MBQ2515565.1 acetylglutamate kinase [Bacteroidales bacterium]